MTTQQPEALQEFEVRKLAAIGPAHTSSGLVERRPIEYRRELEDQFVRGYRAAEKRLHAQVAALATAPDTTHASGAADLPEALRLAAAISNLLCSNEAAARTLAAAADELVRLHAESEMRRTALLDEMQKAALAAGQATAAQTVVPAEWPANEMIDAGRKAAASQGRLLGSGQSLWHVFRAMIAAAPAQPAAQQVAAYAALPDIDEDNGLIWQAIFDWKDCERGAPALAAADRLSRLLADQMRAFADATCELRASHGQAPAQAGEYPALVCDYCGALTPDPWHSSGMLHGKMSKHIHSCDACAARGAAQPQAGAVPLTDEQIKALMQAHRTAMLMTCKAKVPECGEFAAIAQDLDWLCESFGIKGGQHVE